MKTKRKIGFGLAVAAVIYCVLAYIFMWPPVVRYYWNGRAEMSICPCVLYLGAIDGAVNQWALEHGKHKGDLVTFKDISQYFPVGWNLMANGKMKPCYEGGNYSITVVGTEPTCSLGTNSSTPIKIRVDYFEWDFTNALGCNHRLSHQESDPDWFRFLRYRGHPFKQH